MVCLVLLNYFVFGFVLESEQTPAFTYEGSHGPENWGNLSPSFAACSNSKTQSPINIVKDSTTHGKHLQNLVRKYSVANATLINNGFHIAVCVLSLTYNLDLLIEWNHQIKPAAKALDSL